MENITLGQILTTLAFLVSLIGSVEFLAMRMRKYMTSTIQNELQPLKDELHKNSLNTMKNTICNENIPITERISVGREYIEKGGNGAVKIYLHKLEEQYESMIKEGKL